MVGSTSSSGTVPLNYSVEAGYFMALKQLCDFSSKL